LNNQVTTLFAHTYSSPEFKKQVPSYSNFQTEYVVGMAIRDLVS